MTIKQTLAGIGGTVIIAGGGAVITDQATNPYKNLTPTALAIVASSTLQESGNVTTIVSTDKPRIELDKWNNEVKMGITYTGLPGNTTGARPFLSKNVNWSQGTQTMEAVPIEATTTMEDGGMEINIILNSAPASNVFTFQLDNWQNLDFFYQAPLWQEVGLKAPMKECTDTNCTIGGEGINIRPDNVVGSYAVYYKDHANHIEGRTNYATGKAYHIFRPLVTDSNGATVWADLSYADGVLSVTVPQSFLDSAMYPMKIDPTFGYTTIGGTESSGNNNTVADRGSLNNQYTASSGDTITQYSIYSRCDATGTGDIQVATYSISGGQLSTRLSTAQTISFTNTTAQWNNSGTLNISMTGGTIYDVAMGAYAKINTCGVSGVSFYFDTLSGNQGDVTTTTGDLPASWTHNSFTTISRSVYATYTASGGGTPDSYIINFQ